MVINSIKKVLLKDMHKQMQMPKELTIKIEKFWQNQIKENPHLFNGRVWNVTGMQDNPQSIELILEETDYAHYLYDERHGIEEKYSCHNLSGGVLIETLDGFLTLGELDETTSYPRCLQVSGGGIDSKKDRTNGEFDIIKTVERELKEELNLDLQDKRQIQSFNFKYLEVPEGTRHSYSIILKARANLTAEQLQQHFTAYRKSLIENQGETEFSKLYFLPIGSAVQELEKLDNPKRVYVKQVLEIEDKEKRRREELEER